MAWRRGVGRARAHCRARPPPNGGAGRRRLRQHALLLPCGLPARRAVSTGLTDPTPGSCSHRQTVLVSVIGGREFTATLSGGHSATAAVNASTTGVTFYAGQPASLDFKVADADGDPLSNQTVRVDITVQERIAGSVVWTSSRHFQDVHGGTTGFTQPAPRFTFDTKMGLTEIRFTIRTEELDPKARNPEAWSPPQYVEMGFVVDVLPAQASPAGLTPFLIVALVAIPALLRRR